MHPACPLLCLLTALPLAGCASKPALKILFSELPPRALQNKTLAVAGLSTPNSTVYPGQIMEREILRDAGLEAGHRLKHSHILMPDEMRKLAGSPAIKLASRPSMRLGSSLTPGFLSKARSCGIDYLLWIDLTCNEVTRRSRQWHSTRMEYSACSCGYVTEGETSTACRLVGSCRSGCCRSCHRGEQITEFHSSESNTRSMHASHQLIDTATGRCVWRADSAFSNAACSVNTSKSGFPLAPPPPLPDGEAQLMRSMSEAALGRLPR